MAASGGSENNTAHRSGAILSGLLSLRRNCLSESVFRGPSASAEHAYENALSGLAEIFAVCWTENASFRLISVLFSVRAVYAL